MTLSKFVIRANANIKSIMFRNADQAETVSYHLRDAVVTDNLLSFGDAPATAVAIELADIATDDYCFIGEKCRLPFIPRDVDMDNPCVYAASLSDYNNGRLHGMWIDATQDEDDIQDDIEYMLSYSHEEDAEEWAWHDHQGFCGLSISEYESVSTISELGQLIAEHGAAYAAYANNVGVDYATTTEFEDVYHGEWDSELAFAEQLMDDTMEIPEHLVHYIDYEKWSNDLFMTDYYSVSVNGNGGRAVYVFSNQ